MPDTKPAKAVIGKLDAQLHLVPDSGLTVQFNPESLAISHSLNLAPRHGASAQGGGGQGGQSGGTGQVPTTQYAASRSSTLSATLWLDVTAPGAPEGIDDVRLLTKKLVDLMQPQATTENGGRPAPPQVGFHWGSLHFNGDITSLNETLEFFSDAGVPLRAQVALSMVANQPPTIEPVAGSGPGQGSPGSSPLLSASAGFGAGAGIGASASLPGLTASAGIGANWQGVAAANGIENPRLLEPGQLIDVNAKLSASASISFG